MKKIILFNVLLSSYAFASDNSSKENFDTHPIFKNYTTQQMNQILSQEKITPIPIEIKNSDVGFNMPAINLAAQKILEQCSGQNIIEFGPGCGFFMGKLLAAGANHVTGIELSKNACLQVPSNIKSYELNSNSFTEKYKVINANFCNDSFKVIRNLNTKYDQIIAFNVLHYLTPSEATSFLGLIPSIMQEGSTLTVSMNAPSGDKVFVDAYKKALQNGGGLVFQVTLIGPE